MGVLKRKVKEGRCYPAGRAVRYWANRIGDAFVQSAAGLREAFQQNAVNPLKGGSIAFDGRCRVEPEVGNDSVDVVSADAAQGATDHFAQRFCLREKAFIGKGDIGKGCLAGIELRSEEQTSELQSLMRNSYDVFCL